ncbi:tetratricopeptide (TPR) repeat protein [Virgibacillus natechei]|uniref:Tetratricopeptide (TPR) repeat protein n=1 Tax=Virgibacillus natechei TaxID=1216297 RepID=A0ABS4IG30_9BACI|nr:tetratricopeptide repeat protein [Virgibacillus natechei]MBP1969416.1 tetratricopeptide (TPR) repeat protein [Virgibacillus natechei]UZD11870.1 tetratricopeptide repeat protein [Virgibacillus natechei]
MQQVKDKTDGKQNNIVPFIPEGDFYFTKGVEAFQKRKFDISIKWIKKAIEAKPEEALYQCQMSIIYTEIGSFHKANQLLTEVLQSTDYVDCYYLIANNYAHLGLLNDAKKYANSYIDKEPNGDFTEEAKRLLHLIDIDEEDDEEDNNWDLEEEDELLIYQETVFYHMENRQWEKALPLIEEMMTLFPDHKLAKHDYAKALFYFGHKDDAIQMEQDILEEDPTSLYSHTNLALFYYELNQKQAYERNIQALLNVYPIHEQQKLRIAVTLARTGYYQDAYNRFRSLIKSSVNNHVSYYRWYSIASYHVGKQDAALALWEEGSKKHSQLANEEFPLRS